MIRNGDLDLSNARDLLLKQGREQVFRDEAGSEPGFGASCSYYPSSSILEGISESWMDALGVTNDDYES